MTDAISHSLAGDGFEVTLEREVIEVRTGPHPVLDPTWSFTDAAGHVHISYDTLKSVVLYTYWCYLCQDEHEETEWRCKQCDERIEPKYVTVPERVEFIPGLLSGTLRLRQPGGVTLTIRLHQDDLESLPDPLTLEWAERVAARPDARLVSMEVASPL